MSTPGCAICIYRTDRCVMICSAAVGLCAIQLAHLSGYKVVTTASLRNHDLLKSLGADVTIDYRDPDVVSKIKQATGDSLKYVVETTGENETHKIAVEAIGPSGGKVVGLNVGVQNTDFGRKDVTITGACSFALVHRRY